MQTSVDRPTVRRPVSHRAATALAGLLLACGACSNAAADRAGGDAATQVKVLTLAQPNDTPGKALEAWAAQVATLSKGALKIEFRDQWRNGEPDYEVATIGDVRTHKVDLAWVGARAFDQAGATSFQALLAPMLVDSQALQAKVFEAGIPAEMARQIQGGAGVEAVGVLPGPLRKVLGMGKPYLRPADFRGAVVGMQASALTRQTIEALGGTAKAVPTGARLTGLDAYEQQLSSVLGNRYTQAGAKFLTTNLDLWPRPLVVVADPAVMASLSAAQQAALRDAATSVLPVAAGAARAEDADAVEGLCRDGMKLVLASPQDLQALRTALEPVYAELASNAATKTWLERIRALKTETGGAPDAQTCGAAKPTPAASPVDGTWEKTLTAKESLEGCPTDDPIKDRQSIRMVLSRGTAQILVSIDGSPFTVGYDGTYQVFRDRMTLQDPAATFSVTWRREGSTLTLADMQGGECGDVIVWTLHPWKRVG